MDGKGTRERKRELRRRYKEVRATLGKDGRASRDAAIADGVTRLPEYLAADTVLTYLSVGDEVDTRALVRDTWVRGKSVALPWCVPGTRRMRWFYVSSLDGLVRSPFGAEEPVPDPAREVDPKAGPGALAVVPGLSFDERGYRMGYGGGFYDVFLAEFAGASVGLCREPQMAPVGTLALDEHDVPVDVVVTEERVIRPRR